MLGMLIHTKKIFRLRWKKFPFNLIRIHETTQILSFMKRHETKKFSIPEVTGIIYQWRWLRKFWHFINFLKFTNRKRKSFSIGVDLLRVKNFHIISTSLKKKKVSNAYKSFHWKKGENINANFFISKNFSFHFRWKLLKFWEKKNVFLFVVPNEIPGRKTKTALVEWWWKFQTKLVLEMWKSSGMIW